MTTVDTVKNALISALKSWRATTFNVTTLSGEPSKDSIPITATAGSSHSAEVIAKMVESDFRQYWESQLQHDMNDMFKQDVDLNRVAFTIYDPVIKNEDGVTSVTYHFAYNYN